MPVSNASLLDLNCTEAELGDGWTDNDTGPAVSTFEVNAPPADPVATVWSHDTNASAAGNDRTEREKDVGSVEGLGNTIVVSLELYCDAVGARAAADMFFLLLRRSDHTFSFQWASDGFYVTDSAGEPAEVGADLVVQNTWQKWTIKITYTGAGNAACAVYLDNVLKASSVDCGYAQVATDGIVILRLYGYGTDDLIAYLGWLKIGDGFAVEFIPKIMTF